MRAGMYSSFTPFVSTNNFSTYATKSCLLLLLFCNLEKGEIGKLYSFIINPVSVLCLITNMILQNGIFSSLRPVPTSKFQVPNFKFQTSNFKLQTSTSSLYLLISDGMGVGNFMLFFFFFHFCNRNLMILSFIGIYVSF